MTRRPRNHGRPAYDENDSLAQITVTDDEVTTTLQGAGLSIKRVTRNPAGQITVQWRKQPTSDDIAAANALVADMAHAF